MNSSSPYRNRFSRRSGFTLIELLVVIAILALLAAILVPVVSKAKKSGLASKCLVNHKQIATAIQMYIDENEQYFPALWYQPGALNLPVIPPASERVIPNGAGMWWPDAIARYVPDWRVFNCPEVRYDSTLALGGSKSANRLGIGLNHPKLGVTITSTGNATQRQRYPAIAQPTATVMLGDAGKALNASELDPRKWVEEPKSSTVFFRVPGGSSSSPDPTWVIPRHGDGKAVLTYADLHAVVLQNDAWGYTLPEGDSKAQWDLN